MIYNDKLLTRVISSPIYENGSCSRNYFLDNFKSIKSKLKINLLHFQVKIKNSHIYKYYLKKKRRNNIIIMFTSLLYYLS